VHLFIFAIEFRINVMADIEANLGGLDPQVDFFEPLQRSLEQCRAVKVLTK
jgi:hypothetical protein